MTDITLYNTATRRKEPFRPIDAERVRMYVCGPTVYDRAHLGNARPVVVFDTLFRLLRHVYGADHVTYVRNFTDVDDKINARAAETGRPIRETCAWSIRWTTASCSPSTRATVRSCCSTAATRSTSSPVMRAGVSSSSPESRCASRSPGAGRSS